MDVLATVVTGLTAAAGGNALTHLRKFTAGSRIRRTIGITSDILTSLDLDGTEREALSRARRTEVFRLAALSTVRMPVSRYYVILFGFLATTVAASYIPFLNPFLSAETAEPWTAFYPSLLGAALAGGFAFAAGQKVLADREREVAEQSRQAAAAYAPESPAAA